jgi:sigma-E factor negative regulatory protein RseC
MMEEIAKVVAVSQKQVTVESVVKSTCSGCQQVDSCGSGQIAKAIPQRRLTATIESNLSVNVGDSVVIGIPEKSLLNSAWQVYFLPILGLIVCSGFAQWLLLHHIIEYELVAIIFGMLGGYLGFLMAKKLQNKPENREAISPHILKIVPRAIEITQL